MNDMTVCSKYQQIISNEAKSVYITTHVAVHLRSFKFSEAQEAKSNGLFWKLQLFCVPLLSFGEGMVKQKMIVEL